MPRQRPQTAKGTLFVTLEDEQGFVNLVVRAQVYRKHRQLLRTAVLLQVTGKLERVGWRLGGGAFGGSAGRDPDRACDRDRARHTMEARLHDPSVRRSAASASLR